MIPFHPHVYWLCTILSKIDSSFYGRVGERADGRTDGRAWEEVLDTLGGSLVPLVDPWAWALLFQQKYDLCFRINSWYLKHEFRCFCWPETTIHPYVHPYAYWFCTIFVMLCFFFFYGLMDGRADERTDGRTDGRRAGGAWYTCIQSCERLHLGGTIVIL